MRYFLICVTTTFAVLQAPLSYADEPAKEESSLPLVFSEDFEDGTSKWETTDDKAWYLHVDEARSENTSDENAKNHVFGLKVRISDYQPKVRSPHNIAMIKDVELEDVELMFRVRSTKDTGNHRDCCVFFGYQDAEHFYYAHLGAKPDPHSGQIMIVNGEPRKAMTENEKLVPWDDGWHTVKLKRVSATGSIEIYFDDMETPHMQVTDKTFGKGRVGIGSFDDMNDFDDVRLYGR